MAARTMSDTQSYAAVAGGPPSSAGSPHTPADEDDGRIGPPSFWHRLMICCPVTGVPVDTGVEATAVLRPTETQWLVDCLECGQDHPWSIQDAFAG